MRIGLGYTEEHGIVPLGTATGKQDTGGIAAEQVGGGFAGLFHLLLCFKAQPVQRGRIAEHLGHAQPDRIQGGG